MRASWACVEVDQKVTVSYVEYAMNCPCFGREMHEYIGRYDQEMVVEPYETSAVQRDYFDWDFHE